MTTSPLALAGVEVESGCRTDGKPFCTVRAELSDGTTAVGQLSPDEVRMMALNWLSAAEAAESDGATVLGLQNIGMEESTVASFLLMQRANRLEAQKLARGGE